MGSDSANQSGHRPAGHEPAPSSTGAGLLAELLEVAREPSPPIGPRTRIGKLVAWTPGQAPRVEFEGNELGPLAAMSTVALDPTTIREAIQTERGVLLSFEDGKPHAPIITGLIQPFVDFDEPPEVWHDEHDEHDEPDANAELEANLGSGSGDLASLDARVDGRRVELEAADEIVLRCGEACIVLRRNGRVVIRGTYVETRSRGVNRIKGGTVEIN